MRNLLMLLVLANVLYFLWDRFVAVPDQSGVAVVDESQLGPPLAVSKTTVAEAATSVGAVLGSGKPSELAAVVGRSCVSIFFKTTSDADGAIAAYESEGMRASLRSTQGQVFVGNWVLIRKIPDRETGNAIIEKLQAGGITDAYLDDDDDDTFLISLGLFGEMPRAERIELQAKSLDLPAEIIQRMRDATIFYVDIGLPPGKGAGAMIEKYGEERVLLRDKATCPKSN